MSKKLKHKLKWDNNNKCRALFNSAVQNGYNYIIRKTSDCVLFTTEPSIKDFHKSGLWLTNYAFLHHLRTFGALSLKVGKFYKIYGSKPYNLKPFDDIQNKEEENNGIKD